jgi:hypothetical protein
MLHDNAVERARADVQIAGLGPCLRNQKLGSRRRDLKCRSMQDHVHIEVKILRGLRTEHTNQQLTEIREGAEKSGSPALLHVAEQECYSGINKLGQALIQKNGLRMCPCSFPNSEIAELTDCLSKRNQ